MVKSKSKSKTTTDKLRCVCCGNSRAVTNYIRDYSGIYAGNNEYVPICKECLTRLYLEYVDKYKRDIEAEQLDISADELYIEKLALKRICMITNTFYSESMFNLCTKDGKDKIIDSFPRVRNLVQYKKNKTYDTTIDDERNKVIRDKTIINNTDASDTIISPSIINFFGVGFTDADYIFLKTEYDDWTARHECKTKAQEEIIKDICFNRLQNLKALQKGEDTKDITASFQKLLDAGKLQPKQNSTDTLSDSQTFGTLIDKWENTRPIPEIAEEFRDVDKIGLYLDVFFRGHLAKMMNIKNGLSNLYSKYMEKYTAHKPEYDSEESSEAIFDAIFGKQMDD